MNNDDENTVMDVLVADEEHVLQQDSALVPNDRLLPFSLPILVINSPVIFPTLLAPIMLSNAKQIQLVEDIMSKNRMVGLLLSKSASGEEKTGDWTDGVYQVGVAAKVIKRLKLPDDSVNILLHSVRRFQAKDLLQKEPYLVTQVEYLEDVIEKSQEMDAIVRLSITLVKQLAEINPFFTDELKLALLNAPNQGVIADLIAFSLTLPKLAAQTYLETLDVKKRFELLLVHLRNEQELGELQKKIHEDVNNKLSKMQREFFLREQLKAIKKELGTDQLGSEKSAKTFRDRIQNSQMPQAVAKIALEELDKLENMSEQSPEQHIVRNYLELVCSLPWSKETKDNLDLKRAKRILSQEHLGLDKVKARIIEFLAVRKLKNETAGSAICLVGPPGVGKTSIGRSIANTLGREFFRFSLGGMRDEAEIKGHRRTYIGAMPGKIISTLKRVNSINPVMMLDEIDKMGLSYQGDPASALLELLDPEQNTNFLDHYLDLPFDCSKILFITTANTATSIPAPLLDRMEVIEIPGYTFEEKKEIAIKHLIPKECEKNGISKDLLQLSEDVLTMIITDYAREPGLRSLQKMLNQLCRKIAAKVAQKSDMSNVVIDKDNLQEWLGPKRFLHDISERVSMPGVMTGLAWTSLGGEILFIEAISIPNGSGLLKCTGQMGDVMSESANIAWSYVKKLIVEEQPSWDPGFFKNYDIHLHIPAGAIPKDGPSAGITMAMALYSLLTQRKAKDYVAMTGELSLVGKILAVGGIKEKLLAAHRAGVKHVVLPYQNEKDVLEIPSFVTKHLKITFVRHFLDAIKHVLEKKDLKKVR